ncbi:ABC transporter ATP-binding protein [Nocardiopsis coralli]|uniref:ABC transporter ATP-binding protein n=1 Tax=Nocardiopsis coralli TaxID=2772213 RepID=UPI002E28AE78|nr:ABC transporter ATP-binding protein [Nocardiopsis coralli]
MTLQNRDSGDSSVPLLEVEDLQVEFHTRAGVLKAVDGVSFSVDHRETLAVLGESGSGKSVTAQTIMGILDMPPAVIAGGAVRYRGTDLLGLSPPERRAIRGQKISMIFQDALSALNPVFSVGWQIAEMFRVHRGMSRREAKKRAIELMERVHIPAAAKRVDDFPHQFSGGMRQRIMIAMAIALDPEVLIADEPTTALDVTVQAQIMELLAELQEESGMGLILITHDLGVVADIADRTAVMYAGRVMEQAGVFDAYAAPAHPYTKGLLESIPRLDQKGGDLFSIPGTPPDLLHRPSGCAFRPRCRFRTDECLTEDPPLHDIGGGRGSACHHYQEVLDDAER